MPKKSNRNKLKLVTLRLKPETIVALEMFVAHKNITNTDTDRTKLMRKVLEDHTKQTSFIETLKTFKINYPEKYNSIIEKYAKGV